MLTVIDIDNCLFYYLYTINMLVLKQESEEYIMAEKKEEKLEETKKSNKILVTVLIIVLMGVCVLGGWLIGAAKVATDCVEVNEDAKETLEKANKETTKEETAKEEKSTDTATTTDVTNCEPEKIVETAKPRCYGTYTLDGTQGNEKRILKEDGTWKVEGKEQFGVFYITGDTITFVEMKHTNGPESASYHSPKSYYITDDCKNVRFTEPGTDTSAGLTKEQ